MRKCNTNSFKFCHRFLFLSGILTLLSFQSCANNEANEALVRENELLKKQLNEQLKEPVAQTKYVWSILF